MREGVGVYLTDSEIGGRIRELRERQGLSQEELGGRLGVAQYVVSKIERGDRAVTARELVELSQVFGVTTASLMQREAEAAPLLRLGEGAGDGVRQSLEIFRACIEEFHGIEALVR